MAWTKQPDWNKTDPNDHRYHAAAAERVNERNPPPDPLTYEEEFGVPDPTKDPDYQPVTEDEEAAHVAMVAATFAPEAETGPALALPDYLAAVGAFLRRYVVFPSEHELVAVTLWIAHAHVVDQFETSPMLAITSAEMRSGKTRLLDCLELLVPRPFRTILPSPAVVYTVLDQTHPTLLLDEADAIFNSRNTSDTYEGLRAILNSGNRKGTPVPRVKMEGTNRVVEWFNVYGPKAVAGIGDLPDTVADRAIPIRMRRRARGEPVEKFRSRKAKKEAAVIVGDWDFAAQPEGTEVPEELHDRASDGWEALLAIADRAGGDWPENGRLAAIVLSQEEETVTAGIRLLQDIYNAFGSASFMKTADLLEALYGVDDGMWLDWNSKPLTKAGLAVLLLPYRVKPSHTRFGAIDVRGYHRADFADVFARYLEVTPVTPVTDAGG